MLCEYQVLYSFEHLTITSFSQVLMQTDRQIGYSEAWLQAIFANLSDDLALALRDAWLASMLEQRESMLIAEGSVFNVYHQSLAHVMGCGVETMVRSQLTSIRKKSCKMKKSRHFKQTPINFNK